MMTARAAQPDHAVSAERKSLSFDELDKVRLTTAITVKNRQLPSGLVGTIVHCHGSQAYEVEFRGIKDFFQIQAGYLEQV